MVRISLSSLHYPPTSRKKKKKTLKFIFSCFYLGMRTLLNLAYVKYRGANQLSYKVLGRILSNCTKNKI